MSSIGSQLNGVPDEIDLIHPREVVPEEFPPGDIVLGGWALGWWGRCGATEGEHSRVWDVDGNPSPGVPQPTS